MEITSTGQLRAQSISIMVSERKRCNARCLPCISRTTPGSSEENSYFKVCGDKRLRLGLSFAERLGATHAILTGKADPTQEQPEYLCKLISLARTYVPAVDMHTNGWLLQNGRKGNLLQKLDEAGLTMITFSIASFNDCANQNIMGIPQDPEKLIKKALKLELTARCSVVMNKMGVADFNGLLQYIHAAGTLGAHMVVVREVWIPDVYGDYNHEVYEWNKQNIVPIRPIEERFRKIAENRNNKYGIQLRDPLPWGTPVFAVSGFKQKEHGVNVTFARCDEASSGPVIKSIVHKPDGHGYRNWDHNGDILY